MSYRSAVAVARERFNLVIKQSTDEDRVLLREWMDQNEGELYQSALDIANSGNADYFPIMALLDRLLTAKEKWYAARGYNK